MTSNSPASIHHIELWLHDLAGQLPSWNWLFGRLGWLPHQGWSDGRSWQATDGSYLVIEESPDLAADVFDRTRAGINHLALNAERSQVDAIAADADDHGWNLLFADRHPYAGGAEHYAAYLENEFGFEVELVAG